MKFFTNKNVVQKIIIAVVIIILFNFAVPVRSQAAITDLIADGVSDLVIELMHLVTFLGDSVMNMLSYAMVGTEFGSIMVTQDDPNLEEGSGSYIDPTNTKGGNVYETEEFKEDELDGLILWDWSVPNIIYCPENIFANKIAALDVNFINPNEYQAVNDSEMAERTASSAAAQLRPTIATWYRSFRNIAIVGLLSVLVYLGIRILIGSTAQDKAKYKERLKDWAVALCLVFIIHFIMSGILIVTENITSLFSSATEQNIIVTVDNGVKFKTNLTGYIRFQAQTDEIFASISYTIIYVMLVAFTAMFTFTYLKRLLYMAFCTMIAPLVALTYPIDKAGDGKAQAFNMWFKEYFMNAILQPIHLLLYSALVTSAMSLAINNPIYAVAAIGFMIPAEKFVKKMFGLDKASTPGGLGSFAAGAVASQGINYLSSKMGGKSNSGGSKSDNSEKEEETYKRPKTVDRGPDEGALPQGQEPAISQGQDPAMPQGSSESQGIDENQRSLYENSRNIEQEALDEATAEGFGAGDVEYDRHQQEIDRYNNLLNQNQNQNGNNNMTPEEQRQLSPEEQRQLEQAQVQRQLSQQQQRQAVQQQTQDGQQQQIQDGQQQSIQDAQQERTERGGIKGVFDKQVKNRWQDAVYANGGGIKGGATTVLKAGAKATGAVGKPVLKAAGSIVAATTVGAAMAASGDPSTVAKGLAAAIPAGRAIGGAASNKVGKVTSGVAKMPNKVKNTALNSGWYTSDQVLEKEQEKYDKQWMHSKENMEYLRAQGEDPAKWMNDGITQEFLKNDITDINTIYNAKKLMKDKTKNVSQKDAIQAAKYAKKIPKGFEGNDTAKEAFVQGQMRDGKTEDQAKEMRDYVIYIQKDHTK